MRKILIILMVVFALGVKAQSVQDLINLKYAKFGVEMDTNAAWHQNGTAGYFLIVPTTTCVVDSITWMTGQKPKGFSVTDHRDSLRVGITYPYPVYKIKLLKGKCLLYRNK